MASTLPANARGIPAAPFIENMAAYVGSQQPDAVLQQLQELLAKYRFMEASTNSRKENMLEKVPEFKETIDIVRLLQTQSEADEVLESTFELSDTLYAKASIQPSAAKEVYLWLGANVMLAYSYDDAIKMLSDKLRASQKSLDNAVDDLDYLREQITVSEVNIARCHNYLVKIKRSLPAETADPAGDDEETTVD